MVSLYLLPNELSKLAGLLTAGFRTLVMTSALIQPLLLGLSPTYRALDNRISAFYDICVAVVYESSQKNWHA